MLREDSRARLAALTAPPATHICRQSGRPSAPATAAYAPLDYGAVAANVRAMVGFAMSTAVRVCRPAIAGNVHDATLANP